MTDKNQNNFKKILCYEIKKDKKKESTSIEDFKVILKTSDTNYSHFDKIA